MAKKQSADDLLEQLRSLIKPASTTQTTINNKKAVAALRKAMNAIEAAIEELSGPKEAVTESEPDAEAPYGRKKDGTPKSRSDRVKAK